MSIIYKEVGDDHLILFPESLHVLGAGKCKAEAMSEAIETLSNAIGEICKLSPIPELNGLWPVVLYFGSKEDADECTRAIEKQKKNFTTFKY